MAWLTWPFGVWPSFVTESLLFGMPCQSFYSPVPCLSSHSADPKEMLLIHGRHLCSYKVGLPHVWFGTLSATETGPKVHRCVCLCVCRSVVSHSLRPQGLYPARLLCPWDSPGKNTGAGCHSLVQGIFPAQRLNLGLLHYRQILYRLSHQGSPMIKQPKFLMSLCLMT